MMNLSKFVLVAVCGFCIVSIAKAQDWRIDALAPGRDDTRIGPGTLCDESTTTAHHSNRSLRLSLIVRDRQAYKIGERAFFEITIKNSGSGTIKVPSQACSKDSPLAYQSGVLEACINLNYTTSAGATDWFTGPCLCGREDSKNLIELEPGESLVVQGNAEILTGGEVFATAYQGQKPTLILEPDINFVREYFPPGGGKNALDGCVDEIATQVEAENKASLQIAGVPHYEKSPLDAPPQQ